MRDHTPQGFVVDHIRTQRPGTPDDVFITCNSFEERCLGVPTGFERSYMARYSCIFRYEANAAESERFERDRKSNFEKLYATLGQRTLEKVIPIFCNRQNVDDGIGQFKELFQGFLLKHQCSVITIDMTCFTKLYLFELLYFLSQEAKISSLQVAYSQAKAYGSGKLTVGVSRIFYIPHFAGQFLPNRETVLIAILGFETERALGLWEHYEPFRTIVMLSDPPGRKEYLRRAEDQNAFLLSRPGVIRRTTNPYDPFDVVRKLEKIYQEECMVEGREVYNVAIISLGTKVQSLGLFLFWLKHKNVRISYAFPQRYGDGYNTRQIGNKSVYQLDLGVQN